MKTQYISGLMLLAIYVCAAATPSCFLREAFAEEDKAKTNAPATSLQLIDAIKQMPLPMNPVAREALNTKLDGYGAQIVFGKDSDKTGAAIKEVNDLYQTLTQVPAAPTPGAGSNYLPPVNHAILEDLARNGVYDIGRAETVDGGDARSGDILTMRGDADMRSNLAQKGFTFKDSIEDAKTGMQAMVLQDANGKNYIIFRGTEPTQRDGDLTTDAQLNVGIGQYEGNKSKTDQWAKDYPGATVSGHSLGSSLAQHYINDHPDSVGDAVLFNAPGVSEAEADHFAVLDHKPPITYYQGDGDLVSQHGGAAHLTGTVVVASGGNVDYTVNALNAHRGSMLQPGDDKRDRKELPRQSIGSLRPQYCLKLHV